jgi:hypothetical protein
MPCVSDNGATAPISALTYAFSIGSDRGFKADDSEARIIAGRAKRMPRVNRIDKPKGEARPGIRAGGEPLRMRMGGQSAADVVNRIDNSAFTQAPMRLAPSRARRPRATNSALSIRLTGPSLRP